MYRTKTAIVIAADSSVLSLPRLPQTPGPLGSIDNKGSGASRGVSVSSGESVGRSTVLLRELERDPPSSSIFSSSLQLIKVEGAADTEAVVTAEWSLNSVFGCFSVGGKKRLILPDDISA
jgi:hypothetical protein